MALLAGCARPQPTLPASQLELGGADRSLRGIAGDGTLVFAATTSGDGAAQQTVIEARSGNAVRWKTELAGAGGPLARTGSLLVAAIGGIDRAADVALRGSPGAIAVGLDAATGAPKWKLAIDSSEWSVISSLAPLADGGVLVGGSFSGTLRAAAKVVSSGGKSDGFVARVSSSGEVAWLIRIGGPGADAIQGVAAADARIAIAGTFAAGADLLGTPLEAREPRSLAADGFVAELDPATGAPRWSSTFGSKLDDAVAGVAIDHRGRVVVAAQARDTVHINGHDLVAKGPADALVAWWGRGGSAGPALLLGGPGFDGASTIAASSDRIVVGCFSADGILIASLDNGTIVERSAVGRGEVIGIAAIPGGYAAGLARPDGAATIIIRPAR